MMNATRGYLPGTVYITLGLVSSQLDCPFQNLLTAVDLSPSRPTLIGLCAESRFSFLLRLWLPGQA